MHYLCARFRNRTEVVNEVSLCHTDTSVTNGQEFALLVRSDTDEEFLPRVENRRVGKGGIPDFVKSIRSIGDDFTKEDLLVGVEGVYITRD